MTLAAAKLDHVVIDVHDRMEEAVRTYRSLGFQLTGRGVHTLGSINHLAVFGSNYIELLGMDDKAPVVRPDIARFPVGLNGLVFSTDQTESLFCHLQARNVSVEKPVDFSRPVNLPEGTQDAKFRVVRLNSESALFGRVYFCHHLTPHLVWRPEWSTHGNGAKDVAGVIIAARDPALIANTFKKMFGEDAVRPGKDGTWILPAGEVQIEVVTPANLAERFGGAAPDPAGRLDYMAALRIRTMSLSQTAAAINAGGVRNVRIDRQRVLVPADQAMNVAIEFEESR